MPYNQAHNVPGNGTHEWEHPIAGAALRASGVQHAYRREYTIRTPRGTHRAAVDGGGGGITSTGYSATAQQWSQHMGRIVRDDPVEAVRLSAIEQINAHFEGGTLDRTAVSGVHEWVQAQVAHPNEPNVGRQISQNDANQIINAIWDHALNWGLGRSRPAGASRRAGSPELAKSPSPKRQRR